MIKIFDEVYKLSGTIRILIKQGGVVFPHRIKQGGVVFPHRIKQGGVVFPHRIIQLALGHAEGILKNQNIQLLAIISHKSSNFKTYVVVYE